MPENANERESLCNFLLCVLRQKQARTRSAARANRCAAPPLVCHHAESVSRRLRVLTALPSAPSAECVGPEHEQAGQAASCAGCPNQEACASGPKGPDPGAAFGSVSRERRLASIDMS